MPGQKAAPAQIPLRGSSVAPALLPQRLPALCRQSRYCKAHQDLQVQVAGGFYEGAFKY